jgi:uncharacterized repeat protein (TIGR03803 family)
MRSERTPFSRYGVIELGISKRFFGVVFATLGILSVLIMTAYGKSLAASESILWSFGKGSDDSDGAVPLASLIMDSRGNLYGTTAVGGNVTNPANGQGNGTVFELTSTGVESVLWNFGNNPDGSRPQAGLTMDSNGNLYGTTLNGGVFASASDPGGTVFELTPPATSGGSWTESILWSFGNGTDGNSPFASLIMDSSRNLFGTTSSGGANNVGTVFELTPNGGGWNESVLWSFDGADGANPKDRLVTNKGNLYGTTLSGGSSKSGTVFELTPPAMADGNWSESVLWSFDPGSLGTQDGFSPEAGLVMDAGGNLYGTTASGGSYFQNPSDQIQREVPGTVFELTPSSSGGPWTESILWAFGKDVKGGYNPQAGVIMDSSGNIYGTTAKGGVYAESQPGTSGTAFKLTPPSTKRGKWTESVLWSFGNGNDGNFPGNFSDGASLIMDTLGNLYGTTQHGGSDPDLLFGYKGFGTVFKISSVLTASPDQVNLGNVVAPGTSKPKKVTLANKDTLPAHIAGVTATPPFTIAGSANTCMGQTIAPKRTCSFEVEFAPTTVGEVSGGSIDITYNGTSPAVSLEGNGISKK